MDEWIGQETRESNEELVKEGPIEAMTVGEATEKWMVEGPMKVWMANEI